MIIRSTIVLSIIRFIIIYSKIYGSEGMESRLGNIFCLWSASLPRSFTKNPVTPTPVLEFLFSQVSLTTSTFKNVYLKSFRELSNTYFYHELGMIQTAEAVYLRCSEK